MDKLDGHPDFMGEFVPDNAGESDSAGWMGGRIVDTNERYVTDMDLLISELDDIVDILESTVNDKITRSIKDVVREWRDHTRGYINELTDAVDG